MDTKRLAELNDIQRRMMACDDGISAWEALRDDMPSIAGYDKWGKRAEMVQPVGREHWLAYCTANIEANQRNRDKLKQILDAA